MLYINKVKVINWIQKNEYTQQLNCDDVIAIDFIEQFYAARYYGERIKSV